MEKQFKFNHFYYVNLKKLQMGIVGLEGGRGLRGGHIQTRHFA
jgi:hypothetical protein